ncbi:response regulator [Salipiger sp. 1_MG-2023]|uniref:response regulator n=1 Tax=Salipiger sp. 1_MG-2023 TaxID=3062665 RepID=UPI0026E2032F|nr:response regulator [Salipiger sp. 1_MG-2023]MDO6587675.1 response regulator [Salipiger sp. 1_MG-2023]
MSVDDSETAQEYIRAALLDVGYEDVVSFLNPLDAFEALTSGKVKADLILVDVMMPGIDGVEFCARIRGMDDYVDTPIIMLTSRTDMDTLNHAFLAGASDYLTKPFHRIELQARMRSCLRLKAELDRRRAGSGRRRTIGAEVAEMTEVLNNKAGFQAALLAIPPRLHAQLGLTVFRITGLPANADRTSDESSAIYRSIARLLGAVPLPARNIFCHWDKDLFCLASPDATEESLRETAQAFIAAVADARMHCRESWTKQPLGLNATLVMPRDQPPASGLGQAIAAAERLDEMTGAGIQLVPAAQGGL